jgi:hypothetical protein
MLKMTKAQLPIIKDIKIYNLIKRGIRGGICGVGEMKEAIATANSCIISLDCVNLYGRAMMEPLPIDILEYNEDNNIDLYILLQDKQHGYIFEVDIECPEELHDFFKAYPLFPEKLEGKLLQTLYPKKNYVVLDKYLKFGIKLGYKVTKVHSYIKFKKAPIMKEYIEYNTNKRREADTLKEISKVQYYKNANNMVYGKNIENPEKYSTYIIARGDKVKDIFNKREWKDLIVIDEDEEPIILFDMIYGVRTRVSTILEPSEPLSIHSIQSCCSSLTPLSKPHPITYQSRGFACLFNTCVFIHLYKFS